VAGVCPVRTVSPAEPRRRLHRVPGGRVGVPWAPWGTSGLGGRPPRTLWPVPRPPPERRVASGVAPVVVPVPSCRCTTAPGSWPCGSLPASRRRRASAAAAPGGYRPIRQVEAWRRLHEAVTAHELTGTPGTQARRHPLTNHVSPPLGDDLVTTPRAPGHQQRTRPVAPWRVVEAEMDAAMLASSAWPPRALRQVPAAWASRRSWTNAGSRPSSSASRRVSIGWP
jgi:hypothetical protein